VEGEAWRQHLHAVVVVVRDEHEAVGCDAHLTGEAELQRLIALFATNDATPRAIRYADLMDGMRSRPVAVRHEQRAAVDARRNAVAGRLYTLHVDDAARNTPQDAAEEASD
jgi:hypothetical protein